MWDTCSVLSDGSHGRFPREERPGLALGKMQGGRFL